MSFLKFNDKIDHGRKGVIIPAVFLGLLFALAYYYVQKNIKRLYDNKVFTSGEISDYAFVAKSTATNFVCSFYVDGVKYSCTQVERKIKYAYADKFMGKPFPIIYEKGNPYNCTFLMVPEDFQKINMPFPDSLNWVRKYF